MLELNAHAGRHGKNLHQVLCNWFGLGTLQCRNHALMAFVLIPPPPPLAPLSYSPPNNEQEVAYDLNIFEPIREALGTALRHIAINKTANNPSTPYYIALGLHDLLFDESMAPLWEFFPLQSTPPDAILAELRALRAELSGATPTQDLHPTALPDMVALATLERKINELRTETKTSLKSLAEAVKAPAHQPQPCYKNQTQKPPTPP